MIQKILIIVVLFFISLNFFAGAALAANSVTITPSTNTDLTGWVEDRDVTLAGQSALRASNLLSWVIQNYTWSNVTPNLVGSGDISLRGIFSQVQSVVYALLSLMILIGAFVIIISRGQSLTLKKFAIKFALVVALVFMSFAIVNIIYVIFDIFQSFFLQIAGTKITSESLLNVTLSTDFIGYRQAALNFEEPAFISTLFIKLTAITYYTMSVVLILRKIIMWFFIIASPFFPLFLLFPQFKNMARILIGQFFYWVLYGPLFAIFLFGLVSLWQQGIPLGLSGETCGTNQPNATNIIIAGPKQNPTFNNNIFNCNESFILYLVALLMLWVVIILPFILLKVFLDYVQNLSVSKDNGLVKYLSHASLPLANKYKQLLKTSGTNSLTQKIKSAEVDNSITFKHSPLELMGSIAEKTSNSISDASASNSISGTVFKHSPLENISQSVSPSQTPTGTFNPSSAFSSSANLSPQSKRQDSSAINSQTSSLHSAVSSGIASATQGGLTLTPGDGKVFSDNNFTIPASVQTSNIDTSKVAEKNPIQNDMLRLNSTLAKLASKENTPASGESSSSISGSGISTGSHAGVQIIEPENNETQTAHDFEKVKKTWIENYENLNLTGSDSKPEAKAKLIQDDINKTQAVLGMLNSTDPEEVKKGQKLIGNMLPGEDLESFSHKQVVSYLDAKLAAARKVRNSTLVDGEDPNSFWKTKTKHGAGWEVKDHD